MYFATNQVGDAWSSKISKHDRVSSMTPVLGKKAYIHVHCSHKDHTQKHVYGHFNLFRTAWWWGNVTLIKAEKKGLKGYRQLVTITYFSSSVGLGERQKHNKWWKTLFQVCHIDRFCHYFKRHSSGESPSSKLGIQHPLKQEKTDLPYELHN